MSTSVSETLTKKERAITSAAAMRHVHDAFPLPPVMIRQRGDPGRQLGRPAPLHRGRKRETIVLVAPRRPAITERQNRTCGI